VVVAEVDDAVAQGRAGAQAVEVVQIAAQNVGAEARDRCGRGVRPGEADDLLSGFEKLGDDGRTDPSRCSGDEYAHENRHRSTAPQGEVMSLDDVTLQVMSRDDIA
jgi:hypothetical protein